MEEKTLEAALCPQALSNDDDGDLLKSTYSVSTNFYDLFWFSFRLSIRVLMKLVT